METTNKLYEAAKASPKTIVCDQCKYEFPLQSVNIKESDVVIGPGTFQLTYFCCPACQKVYKVLLKDSTYYDLEKDLNTAKKRLNKSIRQRNRELARMLGGMVEIKSKRLQDHTLGMLRKFPGTFTLVTSENNTEEIIYHE